MLDFEKENEQLEAKTKMEGPSKEENLDNDKNLNLESTPDEGNSGDSDNDHNATDIDNLEDDIDKELPTEGGFSSDSPSDNGSGTGSPTDNSTGADAPTEGEPQFENGEKFVEEEDNKDILAQLLVDYTAQYHDLVEDISEGVNPNLDNSSV